MTNWGMQQIRNGIASDFEMKKKRDAFYKRQNEQFEEQTRFIDPIPDMRDAVKQVRKNKTTLADSLINATTTKTYK